MRRRRSGHDEQTWRQILVLINCVVYQEGKKLKDIPVEDISDYINRPECFV